MSSSDLTQKKDHCECSVKTKPKKSKNESRKAGGYWEGRGEKENLWDHLSRKAGQHWPYT